MCGVYLHVHRCVDTSKGVLNLFMFVTACVRVSSPARLCVHACVTMYVCCCAVCLQRTVNITLYIYTHTSKYQHNNIKDQFLIIIISSFVISCPRGAGIVASAAEETGWLP